MVAEAAFSCSVNLGQPLAIKTPGLLLQGATFRSLATVCESKRNLAGNGPNTTCCQDSNKARGETIASARQGSLKRSHSYHGHGTGLAMSVALNQILTRRLYHFTLPCCVQNSYYSALYLVSSH